MECLIPLFSETSCKLSKDLSLQCICQASFEGMNQISWLHQTVHKDLILSMFFLKRVLEEIFLWNESYICHVESWGGLWWFALPFHLSPRNGCINSLICAYKEQEFLRTSSLLQSNYLIASPFFVWTLLILILAIVFIRNFYRLLEAHSKCA